MIYFKIFKPQRTQRAQRKNYKRKPGVFHVPCGEKIKDWPTKRPDHKE